MRLHIFLFLLPLYSVSQNIVTPNSAIQGEYLQVFISGTEQDFYTDYSDCYTSTRFVSTNDYSSVINMYGSNYNWGSGGIYENINTDSKPLGTYDLQTRGCQTNWSWETLATDVFTINPAPQIQQFFPMDVLANTSFALTIIGDNTSWFSNNGLNIRLKKINGSYYYPFAFNSFSNSLIIADFDAINNVGDFVVQVYEAGMGWYEMGGFHVLPNPQITNISPDVAFAGQGLEVHISGNGGEFSFSNWSDTYIVSDVRITNNEETYNATNENNYGSFDSPDYNNIFAELNIPNNATLGHYDVEVYDYSINDWVVMENGFEVETSPKITSLSPTNANQGDNIDLNITHENIVFDFETHNIWLENDNGDIIYTDLTPEELDSFIVQVPLNIPENALPGIYSLYINEFQYNSTIILQDCFEILSAPPFISYVNPSSSEIGENISVIISGINTTFLDNNLTNESIYLINNSSTIISNSVNVLTDDVLTAEFIIPNNEDFLGSYEIVVNLNNDTSIHYQEFLINNFNNYYIHLAVSTGPPQGYFQLKDLFSGENLYSILEEDYIGDTVINQIIQLEDNTCYETNIFYGNYSLASEFDIISSNSSFDFSCPQTSTFCTGDPCYNNNENFIQINGSATVCGAEGFGMGYSITNMDSETLYSGNTISCWDDCGQSGDYNISLCLPSGCYNLNIFPYQTEYASFNIVQNDSLILSGSYDIWSSEYSVGSYQFCISDETIIDGCTDSTAINYNPFANSDDNSCCYNNFINVNANLTVGAEYNSNVSLNISNSNETIFIFNEEIGLNDDGNVNIQQGLCGLSDCFNFSVTAETFYLEFSMNDTIVSSYSNNNVYGDYNLDSNFCITEEQQPTQINYISPNTGQLGESLSVEISGTNMGFSQYYDDYSGMGWYEYSSFQLIYGDYSDTYTINGDIYEDYGNSAQATVYIPNNAPTGEYDVKVYDYSSNNYVYLYNGFTVEDTCNLNLSANVNSDDGTCTGSINIVDISGGSGNYYWDLLYFAWQDWNYNGLCAGEYQIYVSDEENNECDATFYFTVDQPPQINYISPNSGQPGESLSVEISGTNMGFSQYYDDYSGMGWYEYSSFQLIYGDYSDTYTINGDIYEDYGNSATASLYIPSDAPIGEYDVKVYDYNSNSYVYSENSFYVQSCTFLELDIVNLEHSIHENGEVLLTLEFNQFISDLYFNDIYLDICNEYDCISPEPYYYSDSSITFIANVDDLVPSVYSELSMYYEIYSCDNYYYDEINSEVNIDFSNIVQDCDNFSDFYISIEPDLYWGFQSNIGDTISIHHIDEISLSYGLNYNGDFFVPNENNINWSYNAVVDNEGITTINESGLFSLSYLLDSATCPIFTIDFNLVNEIDQIVEIEYNEPSCYGASDGSISIIINSNFNGQISHVTPELYETLESSDLTYFFNGNDSLMINNLSSGAHSFIFYVDPQGSSSLSDYGVFMLDTLELSYPQQNTYALPFEESFDNGMPCDWSNDSRWIFGESAIVEGPYWMIPEHNQFAVSNDDVCDCDMMEDRLISPPLNIANNQGHIVLSLSTYFTGDFGSVAEIEISNDLGQSWQSVNSITPAYDWQELTLDISDFISSDTIQIAFRHSDSHSWGSGFAIDDVLVQSVCIDDDNDGVCNADEIYGCTDMLANNFNELATEDDGSCQLDIYGCTYTIAINYNSEATIDDGSCYFDLQGCTDPTAINYNTDATEDDGSCDYPVANNLCDAAPSGLFVDNIIHNRVVFNWDAPTSAPSYYMIRYRPVGASQWTVMRAGPETANPFTGTSRTRFFHEPSTTYEWSIRARVVGDDLATICQSPWSASAEYTTLPTCPNLENLVASSEANWVFFKADAPDASWSVWQSKAKIRELESNIYRYVDGFSDGSISTLKGNFTASTDYEWHTKAWCTANVNENGNPDPMYHSGWGDFSTFTTEAPCDKLPTNLTTSSNGANTAVTMSWDTPESGAPDHYFLEMTNLTTGAVYEWNYQDGESNSRTKFGQNPGDEISWRIRGACGSNGTSWATIFTQPVTYTLGGARLASEVVSQLDVYPNPSKGEFNISFSLENRQDVNISITNYLGEVIFTEELIDQEGQYNKTIDLGNKANGIYMLNITTNIQNINQKIVIQ